VLLALMFPDPCDPLCPETFKQKAREFLPMVQGEPGPKDEDLRKELLKFIADFANWELATNPTYLKVGRALVKAAHGEEPPLVVDPFAGGGSIPLEALRLGCEAFASDLNPVACLILKVILEDIPSHGLELAEQLRCLGAEVKAQAETELADLYPADSDGARPIAYLWARTVRCESPNCGAEIPLARSLWLCKKAQRRRALRTHVVRAAGTSPHIEFEIFQPKGEMDVAGATVVGAKATCLACGAVLPPERVRTQLAASRGGADVIFDAEGRRTGGARMLAVVTLRSAEPGRHYRLPTDADYEVVWRTQGRLAAQLGEWERSGRQGLCPVPDESMNPIRPSPNARGLSGVTRYGMVTFGDLFTARQKVALIALARAVARVASTKDDAVVRLLALCVDKLADLSNTCCRWEPVAECPRQLFARQAIPMVWDVSEGVPIGSSSGAFEVMLDRAIHVLRELGSDWNAGQIQLADAGEHPLPDQAAAVWFTDPPYYDAIPYADLSDFFMVWLKRSLPKQPLLQDPFDPSNSLSPKLRECVWNRAYSYQGRPKDQLFFEQAMKRCFAEGRRVLSEDGVGSVIFAHQTTEGWEAFLGGLTGAGWTITASWPIATEMASRMRARDNASLATSVHLICRPRPDNAPVGDWATVLRDLPVRVGDWMERLQGEGVRGADLVFACIGPALEIFSRYSKVETADGREVALAEYLEKVWEVVGRSALAQILGTSGASSHNGAVGAVEEDARLTALFLWTLQSTSADSADFGRSSDEDEESADDDDGEESAAGRKIKGYTLVFDVVRRFAQPLGIDLRKWEGRIVQTRKGVVRLLPIAERTQQLFGDDGGQAIAARLEQQATTPNSLQGLLFPEVETAVVPAVSTRGRGRGKRTPAGMADETQPPAHEVTTLDRVHAAMLLQASGRTNALRALLRAEQDRAPDFLRLANALSALYPRGSDEKRLLDAMLLVTPR